MNNADFCARLNAAALSIDGSRWQLAELALECKRADFPEWAERIANHKSVRRHPRTIREWALTADFRHVCQVDGAPFDFYRRAVRYLDLLPVVDIRHMLETAVVDGATGETLSGALAGLLPQPPTDWPAKLAALAGTVDGWAGDMGNGLRNAAVRLGLRVLARGLREAAERERGGV